MISVLNRQRLLSGNKQVSFLLIIPFLLFSCGAFKKNAPTSWPIDDEIEEVVVDNKRGEEDKEDKAEDKKVVSRKTEEVFFKGEKYKVPVHKKEFNIAVLLPFHADASNSSKDRRRADIMLEYYQGMKLAIPDLEDLKSSFHITYYDTDNDTTRLKTLLQNPKIEEADLIIGPTDEDQVRIAAYFAKKRKIPLISPISTIDKLWSDNPYVFNANPSEKMQALEFIHYLNNKHQGEKLVIVRDGKYFDRSFGQALIEECELKGIAFEEVKYSGAISWNKYLSKEGTVILHTGKSKTELTTVVTGLLNKAEGVTLFGPDNWMDLRSLDYSQLQQLNIAYLSTNKAQVPNQLAEKVYKRYTEEYRGLPSFYTYMGYDQLMFACESLDAFGKYFPLFLENKSISYSNTDFRMIKSGNCFHNLFLEIFELNEGEIIRVN